MLKNYKYYEIMARKKLSFHRFDHCADVLLSAMFVKSFYHIDVDSEEVAIAAILHDYHREEEKEKLDNYIKKHNIFLNEDEKKIPGFYHAATAAHYFKDELPESIIRAIRYHTIGSKDMGIVGALIYCSDYLNVGRSYIDGDTYMEYLQSCSNLEDLSLMILKASAKYHNYENVNFELKEFLENGGMYEKI